MSTKASKPFSHVEAASQKENGMKKDEPAVSLHSVTVNFGAQRILDNISLEVGEDEFVVLVGRSGCGKTTVLNLLSGFVRPTTGSIDVLGGNPVRKRSEIGYMFARDALLPWRSALRNVEFGLELRKVRRPERRQRAMARLASLGLENHAKQLPSQLSQGMRQRVALARTWVTDPNLLLMDEPFAALDAQTRTKVQDEFLTTWTQRQVPVVFVTHDLNEAILMADRIVVIREGRAVDSVKVPFPRPRRFEELTGDPEYRKLFTELSSTI